MDLRQQLFAVPSARKSADIVIQAVPWDVTTSYGGGTSLGPQAILAASAQVDLYDLDTDTTYETGFFLEKVDPFFKNQNQKLRPIAQKIMSELFRKGRLTAPTTKKLNTINATTQKMVDRVRDFTLQVLKENKIPGLIGGDHSTPLGAIEAIGQHTKGKFGVLHLDAHADLRLAYQGFHHSHASIMRNVCNLKYAPQTLVQVGIRDFCDEELEFIQKNKGQIYTYFDAHLKKNLFEGQTWKSLCEKILSHLPDQVYLSFDIDGLSPEFCPHTGTPVPGGLSFDQVGYLLSALGHSGKKIIGFDLNEVAPGPKGNEWDANVGARLLFKMCNWARYTHQHVMKM